MGVYSNTGTPERSTSSRITPRPWATAMPVVMFLEKNSSSTAASSGRNWSSSWTISREIWHRRLERGIPGGVVMTPYWSSLGPVRSASTSPKPMVATPGSMPKMRMRGLLC